MKNSHKYPGTSKLVMLAGAMILAQQSAVAAGPGTGGGYRNPGYVNQDGYVSENVYDVDNLAFYGDWDSNRVFVVDVDNMQLLTTVEGTGDGPYGIDQQSVEKAYALTRKTGSLTIVDNSTFENAGIISLKHKPRSTNYNADTGLSVVSGGDKVMSSIIRVERDRVIREVGHNHETHPADFGGSLSTGHPLWVDANRFFMLDRAGRTLQLWSRRGHQLAELSTPTSVHHVFQPPVETLAAGEDQVYYAVAEGNQGERISPAVIRFEIVDNELVQTGQVELASYAPELLDVSSMGSHHADFHPDGKVIYMGSAEGHVFVIDRNTLEIITMVEAGAGAGHTTFAPMHDIAIVTNHNATFMTVIDTLTHQRIRDIEVADSASPDYKSQAHTSGVSPDMKYFYSAASHDGVFFRIDLDKLEVSDRLYLGGNVLMGSFIWDGEGANM